MWLFLFGMGFTSVFPCARLPPFRSAAIAAESSPPPKRTDLSLLVFRWCFYRVLPFVRKTTFPCCLFDVIPMPPLFRLKLGLPLPPLLKGYKQGLFQGFDGVPQILRAGVHFLSKPTPSFLCLYLFRPTKGPISAFVGFKRTFLSPLGHSQSLAFSPPPVV